MSPRTSGESNNGDSGPARRRRAKQQRGSAQARHRGTHEEVLHRIATTAGVVPTRARQIIRDIRHVVDELVTDDVTVVAGSLILSRPGDPVYGALVSRFKDPQWEPPRDLEVMDARSLAGVLSVPPAQIEEYPLAWNFDILRAVADVRGVTLHDDKGMRELGSVLLAWLDIFAHDDDGHPPPGYQVSSVGSERAFEDWLEVRLQLLAPFGYPVCLGSGTLANRGGRQWQFQQRRRPDLVCRVTADRGDLAEGDWLIIENKAGMADLPALEQIQQYRDLARQELATGTERVHGLLLADGVTVPLQEALHAAGVGYVSLTALGYRAHLRQPPAEPVRP